MSAGRSTSVERFLGDEDTACFVGLTGVECIASHLFKQLSIGLKQLIVRTLKSAQVRVKIGTAT